jgi:hypothetical protein
VFYVDYFPDKGGTYMGNWNSSTSYSECATVTYDGADWIVTNRNTNMAPKASAAGASAYWVQFDSSGAGLAATQADCAFFAAYAYVQSHAKSFLIPASADLEFGAVVNGYDKNGDWIMPMNIYGYSLSMHGRGRGVTVINQTASTLKYMVSQYPAGDANIIAQEMIGITLNANLLAGGCLNIHGVRRSRYVEISCFNPQQQHGGKIQYAMWIGYQGDTYEVQFDGGLIRTPIYRGASPAFATAIVDRTGRITGYRITNAGSRLNLPVSAGPGLVTYWLGNGPDGRSYQPCATMPDQPTYTLDPKTGALTSVVPGANRGTGCGGPIYVRIHWGGTIPYGWFFGATDSTFKDIVTSGDFTSACQFDVHGNNHFIHEHPYCWSPVQIRADGGNSHDAIELDSPIRYGLDLQGSGDIISTYAALWNNGAYSGAGEVLIEPKATFDTISASSCTAPQTAGGYAKFTSANAGALTAQMSDSFPAGFAIQGSEPLCDGSRKNWGALIPGAVGR